MRKKLSLPDLASALEEYAVLEGTELGEMLRAMIQLTHYSDSFGPALREALYKEMSGQLQWLKQNCEIFEEVQTVERKLRGLKFREE